MARRFFTLDVFTRDALAGNPLAVVTEADQQASSKTAVLQGLLEAYRGAGEPSTG